jgi:hypothetical protein
MTFPSAAQPRLATMAADLPAGRREAYVWRFCGLEGFSLTAPLDGFRVTCSPEANIAARTGPDRAVRDRDGVYHLMGEDRSYCLGQYTASEWCTAQVRGGTTFIRDVAAVPRAERCERAAGRWPPSTAGTSALARVRRRLVATFGPGCVLCPDPWATHVDHDHVTGQVRGYLCGSCNTALAECRHLTDCQFVPYLQRPPAQHLALNHPRHSSISAQPERLARRACYELVLAGGISPGTDAALMLGE